METVGQTLDVGGHRTLSAQKSERLPEEAVEDKRELATPPTDELRPTMRDRLPLSPATMNISQAAAYVGIAKSTLYTWRTRRPGFGPRAVKAGGALRYRQSDLDAWIEAHTEAFESGMQTEIHDDDERHSDSKHSAASHPLGSMSRQSGPRRR